ncbi:MAG TPA: ankyrin repeat domain-containing protein, partial [Gammaproteobacteria bacterium]|nr:ankyrin repeat domain-containing protein [Gammaproteobacteria bacterium]
FQREKNYYIYNSNDVSGMAKKVTAFAALQEKILKNLYEFSESSSYFALIIHRIGENFLKMKRKKLMAMISHQKNYVKRLDAENLNPLYLATESHDDKLVKWLLKQNAPPNVATLDGRLPLLHASYSGYQKIVKSLLEYGAEPDLEGREGLPLFVASLEGHLNVVKTLFNFGADINKADRDGETALFAAIENSHVDIIQFLLKKGADVQWQRKNGDTPLDLAIAQKKWGIVEMLKKNHYSPRFFDSANDYSISPNPALIPISL